jgi:hypothetical protein
VASVAARLASNTLFVGFGKFGGFSRPFHLDLP